MPHELEYIVDQAVMMCDQGAKPNFFCGTNNSNVKINGCKVCIATDKAPLVNIPEFGVCAKTGSPCVPVPTMWTDTYKVKVKGQQTLLYKSKLPCGAGGMVEFVTSGQVPVSQDELDEMMDEHGEEAADEGWGWWDTAELIPVVGSIIGMVREGAKGNWGMVAANVGFLVLDVAGVVSFGATTAASTAMKTGIKVGIKATAKAAIKTAGKAAAKVLTKQGAKALAKAAAKHVDDIAKATMKVCVFACFPAGTPVHTKDGIKNIENIQVGDWVWAYNEETGETALQEVTATMQREVDATVYIELEGETIETTAEHPFYTQNGWKDAADLTTNDVAQTKNNEWKPIKELNFSYQPKKVYNLEVANWHTYFVGLLAWLVHNAKVCVKGTVKKIGENTYDLILKYKKGWSEAQKKAAREKAEALTKANTKVIKNPKRKSGTKKTFEKAGGKVKKNQDVDHIQDLQLDGKDIPSNMKGLDKSVNRSMGRQIQHRIKNLKQGTKIRKVIIK